MDETIESKKIRRLEGTFGYYFNYRTNEYIACNILDFDKKLEKFAIRTVSGERKKINVRFLYNKEEFDEFMKKE